MGEEDGVTATDMGGSDDGAGRLERKFCPCWEVTREREVSEAKRELPGRSLKAEEVRREQELSGGSVGQTPGRSPWPVGPHSEQGAHQSPTGAAPFTLVLTGSQANIGRMDCILIAMGKRGRLINGFAF